MGEVLGREGAANDHFKYVFWFTQPGVHRNILTNCSKINDRNTTPTKGDEKRTETPSAAAGAPVIVGCAAEIYAYVWMYARQRYSPTR